jgi:hypothetical protein
MAGAAALARSLDSAEGFALAAKATLVQGAYLSPAGDKQALFERAAADAEAALARDPARVDAHLLLALALGHLAELETPLSAPIGGYGRKGNALVEPALAVDPATGGPGARGHVDLRIVGAPATPSPSGSTAPAGRPGSSCNMAAR